MKLFGSFRVSSLCCFYSSSASSSSKPKKRLSNCTGFDHLIHPEIQRNQEPSSPSPSPPSYSFSSTSSFSSKLSTLTDNKSHSSSSKSTVVGTLYGPRRGRVCFCIQKNQFNSKPLLLFEFPIPISVLAREMQLGLRVTLECSRVNTATRSLRSVPLWTMSLNGHKVGYAFRRPPDDRDRSILKMVQLTSAGAGVIPASSPEGEVVYMRASYQRVIGSCDSESYHLINPQGSPGQDLSVFLLRSE